VFVYLIHVGFITHTIKKATTNRLAVILPVTKQFLLSRFKSLIRCIIYFYRHLWQ